MSLLAIESLRLRPRHWLNSSSDTYTRHSLATQGDLSTLQVQLGALATDICWTWGTPYRSSHYIVRANWVAQRSVLIWWGVWLEKELQPPCFLVNLFVKIDANIITAMLAKDAKARSATILPQRQQTYDKFLEICGNSTCLDQRRVLPEPVDNLLEGYSEALHIYVHHTCFSLNG